jgi:hypothetical protein
MSLLVSWRNNKNNMQILAARKKMARKLRIIIMLGKFQLLIYHPLQNQIRQHLHRHPANRRINGDQSKRFQNDNRGREVRNLLKFSLIEKHLPKPYHE